MTLHYWKWTRTVSCTCVDNSPLLKFDAWQFKFLWSDFHDVSLCGLSWWWSLWDFTEVVDTWSEQASVCSCQLEGPYDSFCCQLSPGLCDSLRCQVSPGLCDSWLVSSLEAKLGIAWSSESKPLIAQWRESHTLAVNWVAPQWLDGRWFGWNRSLSTSMWAVQGGGSSCVLSA